MSQYLALARKWRPQQFADYVGQEHVVKALTHALDSGRLHHAFLFTGTRGVGKTTVARLLAKCLNCEQGVSSRPCGACPSCREIEEGRFVDLLEVDAASRTKVDDTRELLENVHYAPSAGRYKVYLIDEVHMLSSHSFNALLKTLEEPPPHVKFLLATTDPQKLPVTVLSRCLQFNLRRLEPGQIRNRMAQILSAEGITFETSALARIARAADGSLRDALSLLDQAIVHGGGAVTEDSAADMLGHFNPGAVLELLEALADGDGESLLAAAARGAAAGRSPAALLDDVLGALHAIALRQVLGHAVREEALDAARLERLAAEITPTDVQIFYQIALIGRRDLGLAPDPQLGLEMTLLRMLAFRPESGNLAAKAVAGTAGSKLQTMSGAGKGAVPTPAAPARYGVTPNPEAALTPPAGQVREKDVDADPGRLNLEQWEHIIPALNLGPLWRAVLDHSVASASGPGQVTIAIAPSHGYALENPKLKPSLEQALSAYFKTPLKLRLVRLREGGEVTPAQRQAEDRRERQATAEQAIREDPMVQAILDTCEGEIVKIEALE